MGFKECTKTKLGKIRSSGNLLSCCVERVVGKVQKSVGHARLTTALEGWITFQLRSKTKRGIFVEECGGTATR